MQINLTLPWSVSKPKTVYLDKEFLPWVTVKKLMIFISVLSILSWVYYYQKGLILTYNDSRSHLDVARRIVDNLQPGFAQIGSVWLPLYHILMLPFISSDFLWRTGLAGSVISMASYILGGYFLLKTGDELQFDKRAKIMAFLVYALNPNMLFMQATSMTESLLIFLSIAAVYYLIRWSKDLDFHDLITSGIFVFLSTLTRYDGWFLLLFVGLAVFWISIKKKSFSFAQGNSVLLLTLAGFGVFLWFGWNMLIFGDPLYFATGPYSAKSQQDLLFSQGLLLTKGDLIFSTFTYILVSVANMGTVISILAAVGLYFFITTKNLSWPAKLAAGLLGVPFIFNIVSLFIGHSVVQIPNLTPHGWFNDRYGLMTLPIIAILIGILAKGKNYVFYALFLILMFQNTQMYLMNDVITIQDGVRGNSTDSLNQVTDWIRTNINDGQLVLAGSSSVDPLIFNSGLPLKQFISEGSRTYWDEAMKDPSKKAGWIIFHKGDILDQKLRTKEEFLTNFRLIYTDKYFYIYKKNPGWGRLTEEEMP